MTNLHLTHLQSWLQLLKGVIKGQLCPWSGYG